MWERYPSVPGATRYHSGCCWIILPGPRRKIVAAFETGTFLLQCIVDGDFVFWKMQTLCGKRRRDGCHNRIEGLITSSRTPSLPAGDDILVSAWLPRFAHAVGISRLWERRHTSIFRRFSSSNIQRQCVAEASMCCWGMSRSMDNADERLMNVRSQLVDTSDNSVVAATTESG